MRRLLPLLALVLAGCTSTTAPTIEAQPQALAARATDEAPAPDLAQIRAEVATRMVTFSAHVNQPFKELNKNGGWATYVFLRTSTGHRYWIGWQDRGTWERTAAAPPVIFDGNTVVYGPVSFVARGRTFTFAAPLSLIDGTPVYWEAGAWYVDDEGAGPGHSYSGAFVPAREPGGPRVAAVDWDR